MLYAIVESDKVEAWPGARGSCPGCRAPVIAKCGEINIWHWAHESGEDCDPWYEPESEWHLNWKGLFPSDQVEVVMAPHRADIVTLDKRIVELQHSSLSPEEVRIREAHYGYMAWIIDTSEFIDNLEFRRKDYYSDYVRFRWKWPRKWMFSIQKLLYFDLGEADSLFLVKSLADEIPCWGYGIHISKTFFCNQSIANRNSEIDVIRGAKREYRRKP